MAATVQVPPEVQAILQRSMITADRLVLPDEQLDRKLYEAVNKVLSAAGGKWNRKAKAHLFDRDPREALGLALQTGKVEHRKNTLQAFYTPPELAERFVALADPQPDECVLEPSCGEGALVAAILRRQPKRLVAFDIDEPALDFARREYARFDDDFACVDFLGLSVQPWWVSDVVVMNPPFAKDQDIDHVMHAWEFVKPGGRLVAIMSPGWQTASRGKRQRFLAFVEGLGGEVLDVEPGAFKSSGTGVHTVMLRLDKPL